MRLLLVEDDAYNAEFCRDALTSEGHEVVVETNGIRGRDRALAEPFDVILLDVRMPGLSGDEVCVALRAAGVHAPILALSAAVLPEQVDRSRSAGFDEYLTKPISPTALRAAVRRHGARAASAD